MKPIDKQKRSIALTAAVTIGICFVVFFGVFTSDQAKPPVTVTGTPVSSRPAPSVPNPAEGPPSSDAAASEPDEMPSVTSALPSRSSSQSSHAPQKASSSSSQETYGPPQEAAPSSFAAPSSAAPSSQDTPSSDTPASSQEPAVKQVNINTATEQELLEIPGVLPMRARFIVQYREEHGPYQSVEDLHNVPGIGKEVLEDLRPYVCVE